MGSPARAPAPQETLILSGGQKREQKQDAERILKIVKREDFWRNINWFVTGAKRGQ